MNNTEMVWRKLPRSIIRDEDMDYIADNLSPGLKAAPYMFYLTALCKADDDGIFDLEDGVIFSRLMRIGQPADVFRIANLMIQRRIIMHSENSTKCMFANWEYSAKEKKRTIEDRRRLVREKIKEEQTMKDVGFSDSGAPVRDDFFYPENDKNQKNVAIKKNDDKNQKNVVKKIDSEREIEEKEIERKETHTHREEREKEETVSRNFPVSGNLETGNEEELTEQNEDRNYDDFMQANTFEPDDDEEQKRLCFEEKQRSARHEVIEFFTKNCLCFNEMDSWDDLNAISYRIAHYSDGENPADMVAGVFMTQFKKLSNTDGYYKNIPLTPENFLKRGVFAHVLELVKQVLSVRGCDELARIRQVQKDALEDPINLSEIFAENGIDDDDPERVRKLILAGKKNGDTS